MYAWRHDVHGGPSPTLRISRQVLESYPAFVLLYHLDDLKVARIIRAQPEAHLVVVQEGSTVVYGGRLTAPGAFITTQHVNRRGRVGSATRLS